MTTKKKIDLMQKTLSDLTSEVRILQNVVHDLKRTKIELTKPKSLEIKF